MKVLQGIDEVEAAVGDHVGYSDWIEVTQERVDAFADATDDHQWIHVDPERAAAGPYGGTIAHGYLTLSLLPALGNRIFDVAGVRMKINYGANKVRFPAPVMVGSKLRLGVKLLAVEDIAGGVQMILEFTFECEGASKPSCVAEIIFRSYV